MLKKAFTLIELLVVIVVMTIFFGIGLAQFNTNTQQVKLKNDAKKLVDVFELAKKKSISADLAESCSDFSGYKVTISSDSYSLFFGCANVYSLVQFYNLSSNVTAITGIGDFYFPPLMTNPNFIVSSVQLKNSNISKCVSISISPIGIFELDETLVGC